MYGIDRLNIQGLSKWLEFKNGRGMLKENWMLTTDGREFGARLVHLYGHEGENGRFEGWRPLGFFQLTHRSAFIKYNCQEDPTIPKGADNMDLAFARQWPRSKRIFIPELFCIHLESEHSGKAANWYGRKSQRFEILKEEPKEEKKVVKEIIEEEKFIYVKFPEFVFRRIKFFFHLIIKIIKELIKLIYDIFKPKPPCPPPHYYGDD